MNLPDRTTFPEVKPFGHLYIAEETVEILENGIRLHKIPVGSEPINRIIILWRYGISDKPYTGATKILPQLMLEGTTKMSGEEIADAIDFQGAWLVPKSDDFFTGFGMISLNHSTPDLLNLLKEIILHPALPEQQFDALKQKAIARRLVNLQRTSFVASEKLELLMVGKDHPYRSLDSGELIENLTLDDVRQAWNAGVHHCPIDIFIGGQPDGKVLESINDFALELREGVAKYIPNGYIPHSPEPPQTVAVSVAGARQATVTLGIPTINRQHPDYVPLRITIIALGGYFGSRLMTNIREQQGLTYGINASLIGIMKDAYIKITADCDPAYIEKVLEAIEHEIEILATVPMEDDEMTRLKMYLGTLFASTLDSPFAIEDYYLTQLTVGAPSDYFEQQQVALQSLNSATIMEMASEYLLPFSRASIVIVKP